MLSVGFACSRNPEKTKEADKAYTPKVLVKKRDDGTLSSVNQIDEDGIVHGIRETYYADGKTKNSRIIFNHGKKNGPSIKYYMNGQIFRESIYVDGKKQGPEMKYYKDGKTMSELSYKDDRPLPGLKEYTMEGALITTYPDVEFKEIDKLESRNKIEVEMICSRKSSRVNFYILSHKNGQTSRVYLITERGKASLEFYILPGRKLDKKIDILVEIPTDLGNTLVRELSYHLIAENVEKEN